MAGSPYVRIDAPMTWNRRPVGQAMIATKASRTKKRLARIARHYGYLSATALIEQWAAQVASEVAEKEEQKAKKEITTRYKHNA